MTDKRYSIILADPPWAYKGTQHAGANKNSTGGAFKHYATMTVDEMVETIHPLKWAQSDCLLFMWATWPQLNQAVQLGERWGFRYVHTPFIWHKGRTNPGYYTLTQTEPVLCFKRGRIPSPRGSRKERQVVEAVRTRHSEKPDEVQHRIDRMFPNHEKLELFARRRFPGWDAWGLEVAS